MRLHFVNPSPGLGVTVTPTTSTVTVQQMVVDAANQLRQQVHGKLIRFILFLLAWPLWAAPTANIQSVTNTQAVLKITGYTGACTLSLSTSPTLSPTHPDVNGTEYSGAGTDTDRADTVTQGDGSRWVTLGHNNADRALAALTTYYGQVSCGGTATFSFTTSNIPNGTSIAWPAPFNSAKWGNRDWPIQLSDLLVKTQHVDPISGLTMTPVSVATDQTFRYPGGGTNPPSSGTVAFTQWAGGSGWTNPGNILNGATSTASTGNTNSIDIYPAQDPDGEPWIAQWTFDDLGVKVFAGGSDASGTNRAMTLCIFLHPTSGCVGTPVSVTAAQGSIALVASSSTDPDTPWPNAFPQAFFAGWGSGVFVPQESRMGFGSAVTCASGTCTIASPTYLAHFSESQIAGDKIFIAGSSPTCTNNMCTISSVTNAAVAVLSESLTISGAAFQWFGWGVRIAKTTATGTLTIGAAYKWAGSLQLGQPNPNEETCSPQSFTSGDSKTVRLCMGQAFPTGRNFMYAIATDGTVKQMWLGRIPASTYFTSTLGWSANDVPSGLFQNIQWLNTFPGTDARTWHMYMPNSAGSSNLYKLHYDGDTTESRDWQYNLGHDGSDYVQHLPSDNWTWSLVMNSTNTLQAQIASLYPSYNATLYGSNWTALTQSSNGTTVYFTNSYAGQNYGAWIAVVDLNSGTLKNLIHTMDGTGTSGYMRFGGLHSVNAYPAVTATLGSPVAIVTNNTLQGNSTSILHGGPFEMPIYAISRSGTFDTNTCMDWPPNGGSGFCSAPQEVYDDQCPVGNPYVFMGANTTGHQCIKFQVSLGGWCNIAPTSTEKSTWACPTSASYSGWTPANYAQPFPMVVGDQFYVVPGVAGGDDEHFRIVQIVSANDGSGHAVIWAQRNAMWDYCSYPDATNRPGGTGVQSLSQVQHATGATAVAAPANLNGCTSGFFVLNGQTQAGLGIYEVGRSLQGHGDLIPGTSSGTAAYVASTGATAQGSLAMIFAIPPPATQSAIVAPTFHSASLPIGNGSIQSYSAGVGGVPWIADSNTLNDNFGGQTIGARTVASTAYANVYDVQALGTASNSVYKYSPMIGYAGRFNLYDASGPSSDIRSLAYAMCYAYVAGECIPASTQGHAYANVPFMYDTGNCLVETPWASTPCIIMGWPGVGGFRQQGWDRANSTGTRSRFLSYCLGLYGSSYVFGEHVPFSSTQSYCGPQMVLGWANIAWLLSLPPWQEDSVDRADFVSVPVVIGSGLQYAEVRFGYSRVIGPGGNPTSFQCTWRAEACDTSGSPYNLLSESRTLTTCTSGCTINIPVMTPNVVYYAVYRSSDGSSWSVSGDTQVQAVGGEASSAGSVVSGVTVVSGAVVVH